MNGPWKVDMKWNNLETFNPAKYQRLKRNLSNCRGLRSDPVD